MCSIVLKEGTPRYFFEEGEQELTVFMEKSVDHNAITRNLLASFSCFGVVS